jgi:Cd2+/Zn2+-exporting ATPase
VRELILAAEKTKLPIMRIVDQYMVFYTPLVLVIGALVWAFTQDLSRVIAVFIVACPCAFVLATPTAMVAALSAAARLGILIKNVADIELAAKINAFVFDKTGTLTTGKLVVSRLAPQGSRDARRACCTSPRPLRNTAIIRRRRRSRSWPGSGRAAGRAEGFRRDRRARHQGQRRWRDRIDRPRAMAQGQRRRGRIFRVDLDVAEGFSLIFVARNGQFIGWVGLQDQTRAEAREALAELKHNGVRRIAMVSGDRTPVAKRVARKSAAKKRWAIACRRPKSNSCARPEAKGYRVAVVGDGVNDAPALAAGDLGIAMGAAGSEVAIHSATIALMNNDLRRLPFLVKLSRQTRSVINQNFLLGFCSSSAASRWPR